MSELLRTKKNKKRTRDGNKQKIKIRCNCNCCGRSQRGRTNRTEPKHFLHQLLLRDCTEFSLIETTVHVTEFSRPFALGGRFCFSTQVCWFFVCPFLGCTCCYGVPVFCLDFTEFYRGFLDGVTILGLVCLLENVVSSYFDPSRRCRLQESWGKTR